MTQTPDTDDPAIPTLTRRVSRISITPSQPPLAPPSVGAAPVPALSSTLLQTLLQVEIERAVNRAIDEAANSVRLRLEQEIPAIVERTLRRIGEQAPGHA